jgi:5-methylcytosine-specific restriction endonuclease McrA
MARYSNWITGQRRHAIYLRDNYTCVYCGAVMAPGDARLTLDHLLAWHTLEQRGQRPDHSSTNVVTCCSACNSSRQDRLVKDFAPGGALARIAVAISTPVDLEAGRAAWLAQREQEPVEIG